MLLDIFIVYFNTFRHCAIARRHWFGGIVSDFSAGFP